MQAPLDVECETGGILETLDEPRLCLGGVGFEAVKTLEDTERTARRVLGGAHPLTSTIERDLQHSHEALRARETPPGSA